MAIKVLCAGDLHLGRSSTRVPEDLPGDAVSATAAWHRVVAIAIEEQAELVCLTGDVADEANRFWEAIGPLEQGIGRLAAHGIMTLAVAGNHDHDVLPRLADQLPSDHFQLLGRDGTWQRYTFDQPDKPALAIDGWSFPASVVRESPIARYALEPARDAVTLALVHGELDAPASAYAPLDRAQMTQLPVDAWLLGHLHTPQQAWLSKNTLALYPGSPQALDPGEPGAHGVSVIEIGPAGIEAVRHRPCAGVRYETVAIDLTGVEDEADVESHVLATLDREARRLIDGAGEALQYLALRLRLTGLTPLAPSLANPVSRLGDLTRTIDAVQIGVARVDIEATPPIDLNEQAKRDDPPGALARLLLALDQNEPGPDTRQLIEQTRQKLEQTCSRSDYRLLQDDLAVGVDEATARRYLREETRTLMNELLAQQA